MSLDAHPQVGIGAFKGIRFTRYAVDIQTGRLISGKPDAHAAAVLSTK